MCNVLQHISVYIYIYILLNGVVILNTKSKTNRPQRSLTIYKICMQHTRKMFKMPKSRDRYHISTVIHSGCHNHRYTQMQRKFSNCKISMAVAQSTHTVKVWVTVNEIRFASKVSLSCLFNVLTILGYGLDYIHWIIIHSLHFTDNGAEEVGRREKKHKVLRIWFSRQQTMCLYSNRKEGMRFSFSRFH